MVIGVWLLDIINYSNEPCLSRYLTFEGRLHRVALDSRHYFQVLLPMSIADKAALIAYVFAMTLAPIAVATALSESYIIIAAVLGLFVNNEKIRPHQRIGLLGAILTAIILAAVTTR